MSGELVRGTHGLFMALAIAAACSGAASASGPAPVLRCGWFDNPTPGNAWLHDRDGEWTIGIQGGHQAKGVWPQFKSTEWVRTGTGSAGYGCVCMRVYADGESREVARVVSARARPLATCRKDPALKGTEPENPLK